jgi:hypothetical protein
MFPGKQFFVKFDRYQKILQTLFHRASSSTTCMG